MKIKPCLTLADCKTIAAAAEHHAQANRWEVSIAIVDDGGHLLWLQRMDGAAISTVRVCEGKARTAAWGRKPSRVYEETVNKEGRVSAMMMPGMVHMEGGVPIVTDGVVVGAVGVSGVKSSDDAAIAEAGIKALLG
ncbi:MAG TPA: heme-binding protein [Burkholderiales bacterium]|jgi:uncharacterized protein GlcG (DUF336 family)